MAGKVSTANTNVANLFWTKDINGDAHMPRHVRVLWPILNLLSIPLTHKDRIWAKSIFLRKDKVDKHRECRGQQSNFSGKEHENIGFRRDMKTKKESNGHLQIIWSITWNYGNKKGYQFGHLRIGHIKWNY